MGVLTTGCPHEVYWHFNLLIHLLVDRPSKLSAIIHECAAGSLRPCNLGGNYSVTVWIWLCQNSSDSQQANLQRPKQPSHRWLVVKNLYQHYCQHWNNLIYMRPSISHSSFCKTNKNNMSFYCRLGILRVRSLFSPNVNIILGEGTDRLTMFQMT